MLNITPFPEEAKCCAKQGILSACMRLCTDDFRKHGRPQPKPTWGIVWAYLDLWGQKEGFDIVRNVRVICDNDKARSVLNMCLGMGK